MRHLPILCTLWLAGCSTHPVVSTLDYLKPGKMYPNEVEPYGGVLVQPGAVLGPGGLPGPVDAVPTVPGVVVPPPVPLPGNPAPPPAFPRPGP